MASTYFERRRAQTAAARKSLRILERALDRRDIRKAVSHAPGLSGIIDDIETATNRRTQRTPYGDPIQVHHDEESQ